MISVSKRSACLLKPLHQFRALHTVRIRRPVVHVGGRHQLAALREASDQHRLQVRARRIDGGRITGGSRTKNQQGKMTGGGSHISDNGHLFAKKQHSISHGRRVSSYSVTLTPKRYLLPWNPNRRHAARPGQCPVDGRRGHRADGRHTADSSAAILATGTFNPASQIAGDTHDQGRGGDCRARPGQEANAQSTAKLSTAGDLLLTVQLPSSCGPWIAWRFPAAPACFPASDTGWRSLRTWRLEKRASSSGVTRRG